MFGEETTITMTKKELLSLLFKLHRPDSAKALLRLGEDGKKYVIQAIHDTPENNRWQLHSAEKALLDKWTKFEALELTPKVFT